MKDLNQQTEQAKKERIEKTEPSNNKCSGIFRALYKDLREIHHSLLHGPVYPSFFDSKYQVALELHQRELIIQIRLKEGIETTLISVTIDKKYLDQYNFFEAIPKGSEHPQKE